MEKINLSGLKKEILILVSALFLFLLIFLGFLGYYLNRFRGTKIASQNSCQILIVGGKQKEGAINFRSIDCPCAKGEKVKVINLKTKGITIDNRLDRKGKFTAELETGLWRAEIGSLAKVDFRLTSSDLGKTRIIYYPCSCPK